MDAAVPVRAVGGVFAGEVRVVGGHKHDIQKDGQRVDVQVQRGGPEHHTLSVGRVC